MMVKKILSLFIITAFIIGAFTGCGNNGQARAEKPEKVTVVLDWVPNTNHTGMYVAIENGYYAEEGLEVEIIQPSAGGSADLIAAGQGDFGISHQEQILYAKTASNPQPIMTIAAIIQHNTSGMASPVTKGIKSPKDFEGKSYGGWGSPIEEAILKGLMEKDGGDYSKLEIVDIGTADYFTAVENYVDFTWIYYGWDGIAAELKKFDLNFIKLQDIVPALEFYTPAIIVHEKLLNENPKLAKKFLKATAEGYDFAIENPEEAGKIFLKHVPELDEEMVIASQKYLAKEYKADAPRWGEMKKEVWETYGDWMYEKGLIENRLDSNNTFTNEYLPKE
ncbi:MAG: ABC transporter substrate-binding protein [Firmicutes bacterium]|nr:ABC transporter substrate-binding protein [Bacillota bacterium]